jgi:serine/threonine-protein kinase
MAEDAKTGLTGPTGSRRVDATAFHGPIRRDAPTGTHPRLPTEMLEEFAHRLGNVGFIYAAAYTLAMSMFHVPQALGGAWAEYWESLGWTLPWTLPFILAAAGYGFAVRRQWIAPETAILSGLGLLVVGSFGITFPTLQLALSAGALEEGFGITLWLCVFIVGFASSSPYPRRHAAVGYLAAAGMVPLAVGAASLVTRVPLTGEEWQITASYTVAPLICAGIGIATSNNVFALGQSLYRARELGSYQLAERIGEGGMGEVWRAEHTLLARPSAIKLIRPEALGGSGSSGADKAVARFQREAQVTASLRSPHTVELYDFGTAKDGTFYYVMELLEGMDLGSLVERHGPVSADRVVHILRQACDSLAEAHDRGLIHRDVKPANIHLCRLGRQFDYVKVLDFGIVKLSERDQGTRLTMEGVITGTPAFMAPEVILQDGDIDHRADLYALGCVAYWLLVGVPVFEGTTPMKVVMAHVNDPPAPPSQRSELQIPDDLEAVVMQCLAKAPGERFQSADDLARRLAACKSSGRWTQQRAREWWERHEPTS